MRWAVIPISLFFFLTLLALAPAYAQTNVTNVTVSGSTTYAGHYPIFPLIAVVLMITAIMIPQDSIKYAERILLSAASAIFYGASYFMSESITYFAESTKYTFSSRGLHGALWAGMFFVMVVYTIASFLMAMTMHTPGGAEKIEPYEGMK